MKNNDPTEQFLFGFVPNRNKAGTILLVYYTRRLIKYNYNDINTY